MKFYNTLGRQVQEFKPLKPSEVRLYTCGPTVYDFAHIGNLRSFVFDDSLRRLLQIQNYGVKHVMNITDVGHLASDADEGEDKLEAGAARENQSVWEVAEHYISAFKEDMAALNVLKPNGYNGKHDLYARATDFIPEQLDIVKRLVDKDYAYVTDQAIYFDVSKLSDYGKLTGQQLSGKEVAARDEVIVDQSKRHPQDFAVWFFKKGRFANHSMAWPSQWGEGFPGWHLECSAIVHATLGEPLDIHTGGVDHIGTHHTNEIAQTEAAFNLPLANYWLHNEHLLVDNQKMSKSLGNFITLKDITGKGFSALALRLLFLQSHYRSQMNFTWKSLEAAAKNLKRLQQMADLRFQASDGAEALPDDYYEGQKTQIIDDASKDLATPVVITRLLEITDKIDGSGVNSLNLNGFKDFLSFIDELLGLGLLKSSDITDAQKELISQREQARAAEDWANADDLRSRLMNEGISVKDTDYGPVWLRN